MIRAIYLRLALAILLIGSVGSVHATTVLIPVDAGGTWLFVDPSGQGGADAPDSARAPTSVSLSTLGLKAGDKITLASRGAFFVDGMGTVVPNGLGMMGVFVGPTGFLFPGPGTTAPFIVSLPTAVRQIPTDIPQDFSVLATGVDVVIPEGATAILFGPNDSFYSDNVSIDYAVVIGTCGDERDDIIDEYKNFGVNLSPTCGDFTQTAHTVYFTFGELNTGDYSWALLRQPLMAPASAGYGLDKWRVEFGGPRIITSAYRNPAHNAAVGGASQSRHMYGDATDLLNVTGTMREYAGLTAAARRAKADFIEPRSGPCSTLCAHADWRSHAGAYVQ